MSRRPVFWKLALVLVACAGGLAVWAWLGSPIPRRDGWFEAAQKPGSLEGLQAHGEVPPFTLTERSGRPVTREDLRGKIWIANLIYTRCQATCPLQSARMAELQADFRAEDHLRLVSISVDPEHDTPAILSEYAERYAADPVRWLFLTGDKRAIYRLARRGFRLGVVDPAEQTSRWWLSPGPALAHHGSEDVPIHSDRFVLVDRKAQIRAYHRPDDPSSLERLRRNVRTLLDR